VAPWGKDSFAEPLPDYATLHAEESFSLNTIRPHALILWAVAVLVSAHTNQASTQQSNKTGSLTLIVTDADDKQPLISYSASLTPRNAGSPTLCNPDYDGLAHFNKIAAGLYRLKVSLVGYFPEIIDSLTIYADSVVRMSVQLHLYNGLTEFDAYEDLAKGIVRIYRAEWFLGPGVSVSSKYGFRNELKCCDPTFKFDRYNAVVYKYLDSLNGPGWYDAYLRDLWSAKVTSDSISKQLNK
jgi:hypothetical protein